MKTSKPKINKIVLEIGGKKLEFTPEEAKELKNILGDLFGGEKITYVDRWHGYWPYSWPHYTYCGGTSISTGVQNVNNTSGALTGSYTGTAWSGSLASGVATFNALN